MWWLILTLNLSYRSSQKICVRLELVKSVLLCRYQCACPAGEWRWRAGRRRLAGARPALRERPASTSGALRSPPRTIRCKPCPTRWVSRLILWHSSSSENFFTCLEHFLVRENFNCSRHHATDTLTSQNFFGRVEDYVVEKNLWVCVQISICKAILMVWYEKSYLI